MKVIKLSYIEESKKLNCGVLSQKELIFSQDKIKLFKTKKSIKHECFLLFSLTLLLTGCESFNNFNDKISSLSNKVQQTFKTPCDRLSDKKFLEQEYETNDVFAYYRKFKLKYNIASAYTLDKRNGVSYCIVNLDYSSNRTVGKMVNSILDTKLALIDRGFGGIELNYKEDALGKIYFDAENPSDNFSYFQDFDRHLRRLDKALKTQTCDLAYQFKLVGVDIKKINETYGYENKCANCE